MAAPGLPAFVRDLSGLRLVYIDPKGEALSTAKEFSLQKVKVATWSPNGQSLAFVDPNAGVSVAAFPEGEVEPTATTLPGSSKNTIGVYWSPLGTTLVTVGLYQKGSTEPNLQLWRRTEAGEFECTAAFVHPKLEAKHQVVKWTPDESFCCRLLPDGSAELSTSVGTAAPTAFQFPRAAGNIEFAPMSPGSATKLAVFVPDLRDDMQRAAAPAEISVWEIRNGNEIEKVECMKAEVEVGQLSELKWCSSGTALLAHSSTEVDDSGKNYYGQTKLLLASADGQVQKDLTETDSVTSGAMGVAVQAVEWSPTRDEFILIRGYQPAKVTLWSWDSSTRTVTCAKVLTEKAHRNFVRFNPFGSLVCIAGFGNLAGEMDFYGRTGDKTDFVRISKCEANCAVSAEWGADGRHLLTAVLFPRMRVDNGLTLWNALLGTKVISSPSDELYEVAWRPGLDCSSLDDITSEEIGRAGAAVADGGGTAKKAAYKPPKARGTGDSTVAAMMRGELSVPDEDRRRRPWQDRKKEKDEDRPSPPLSPHAEASTSPMTTSPVHSPSPPPGKRTSPKTSPVISPKSSPKDGLQAPSAPVQRQVSPMSEALPPLISPPASAWEEAQQAAHDEGSLSPPNPLMAAMAAAAATAGSTGTADFAAYMAAAEAERQRKKLEVQLMAEKQQLQQQQHQQQLALQAALLAGNAGATNPQLQAALAAATAKQRQQQQQQRQQQQQQLLQQQLSLISRDPQALAALASGQPLPGAGYNASAAQQVLARQIAEAAERQRQQQMLQEQELTARLRLEQQQQAQQRQRQQQQQQQQQQQAQQQQRASGGAGEKRRAPPSHGWQYVDPKGQVQGPFQLQEMLTWHRMGFFQPDLPMRCDPDDKFVPLKDLFPPPSVPFESYPRRVPANGAGR